MLMMMSSSLYSLNGLTLNGDTIFNYQVDFDLIDEVKDYNNKMVLVPIKNIIAANAIYYYQLNRLAIKSELLELQSLQIQGYILSIHSCEEEIRLYGEALDTCLIISDKKDELITQERRRTWVYRTTTFALIAYVASTFF